MHLDAIAISNDPCLVGVLRPTLENISVNLEVCPELRQAHEWLAKRKFDGVIIDCDDVQGGVKLLENLRGTESNSKSVSFAVVNGKTTTQDAFRYGANFVLQKPLTVMHAVRCFHAALNFMVRERRRYFRYRVDMPVYIRSGKGPEFTASCTNVSEGGIAVRLTSKLARDAQLTVKFTLPNSTLSMDLKAEVAWADGAGHAGIRFIQVPQSSQYQLDKWLSDRMQTEVPANLQGYTALV